MGSREEHEKMLQEILAEFRKRGLKVINLRKHPDGLLIIDNKIIGIEVTSSERPEKIYQRKARYKNSELDAMIIIGKMNLEGYTPPKAYFLALKLRKQGLKYEDIKKIIKKKFNVDISTSQICNWCLGHSKPRLVR